jgi:hypothetical protein
MSRLERGEAAAEKKKQSRCPAEGSSRNSVFMVSGWPKLSFVENSPEDIITLFTQ